MAAGSGVTSEIVGDVVGVGVGDGVTEAVGLAKVLVETVAETDGDEEGVCSLRALLPEHPVNNNKRHRDNVVSHIHLFLMNEW